MKKPPSEKVVEDIRLDVDDILWCELNKAEKDYVRSHEKLAITFAEQLHQTVPTFIGRKGKGKFLSWSEYKDHKSTSSSKKSSKKSKGAPEPDHDKPAKKRWSKSEELFQLVNEPTDSE